MNIVVLDGYTLNPGDLDWRALETLGNVTVYDRTSPEEVYDRCREADCILTNKVVLNASILSKLPRLKYIGVLATGYNIIDVAFAKKNEIIITNIPGYSTNSVAQMVFGYILELTHHIGRHSLGVHRGTWSESRDFSYWETPLVELAGKVIGLIGFGKIAQKVAQIAQAFDLQVLVHTRTIPEKEIAGITFCSKDELFANSDIVSLHCPLTEQTEHIINKHSLEKMKPTAFLINTGRGPLIDEQALAEALNNGVIAGCGLDVLTQEPPQKNNPLLGAPHCYITPHFAWATKEARIRLMDIAVNNLRSFIDGKPVHVV